MGVLIERLLGKASGFSRTDLDQLIADESAESSRESHWLDYKQRPPIGGPLSAKELLHCKQTLSKAAVAFLNKSIEPSGLIVAGVEEDRGRPTRLTPFKDSEFTHEKLRSWFHADIQSSPARFGSAQFEIVPISIGADATVYLIEVSIPDASAAFYSVSLNQAYLRRTDESVPVSPAEFMELVTTRVGARVFLQLQPDTPIVAGQVWKIKVAWVNDGIVPGRELTGQVTLTGIGDLTAVGFQGSISATVQHPDISHAVIEFSTGLGSDTRPAYPHVTLIAGVITIPPGSGELTEIETKVWESRGASIQTYQVLSAGANRQLRENARLFAPYS